MRGLYSSKTQIRHKIFTEIARMAYEGDDPAKLEELPYQIIPGEVSEYRNDIFIERAVVGERLRVAMGMSLRSITEHAPISQGVEASIIEEKYYEPPLINVIKFACNACTENRVFVTEGCQGCLDHPCTEVCPKKVIHRKAGNRTWIDEENCIKCGRCIEACPYNAIIHQERPCSKACGMDAIHSDQYGRAEIDQDKCVSCGMCLVSCPFCAIVDKGQIYQTIMALKSDTPVIALLAPAVAGQFREMQNNKIKAAFRELGFTEVREVAVGADLCTIEEAKDFLKEVPENLPFMATSCCPSWSVMAKKLFPEQAKCISMAMTPMVLSARLIKESNPDCKIVFIGPCAAKKLEASRKSIRSYVDFVLTFEEVGGMMEAKKIDWDKLPDEGLLTGPSSDGRGFAVSGGVAKAVANAIKRLDPEREIKVVNAEGLKECKKMLQLAKAGKYNGYLLEGMACPGGCIAGAGTLEPLKKSTTALEKMMKEATFEESLDTKYENRLAGIKNLDI